MKKNCKQLTEKLLVAWTKAWISGWKWNTAHLDT